MNDDKETRTTTDQILDLLLDALLERQAVRQQTRDEKDANPTVLPQIDPHAAENWGSIASAQKLAKPLVEFPAPTERYNEAQQDSTDTFVLATPDMNKISRSSAESEEDHNQGLEAENRILSEPAAPLPTIHLNQMLARLGTVMVVLLILVNIPVNRYGTSLARAMPDPQSIIIRDGLVMKGSGPEVYVLENSQKRWITTLDAFVHYGYRWEQVNDVEDRFLDSFPDGQPIYLLVKCTASPHVYVLEDGHKRWIKDIPTFQNQGFVWEDIQVRPCAELRAMPDGVPIPVDAGNPPQP